jgi:CRISPR-associated protein Cas1
MIKRTLYFGNPCRLYKRIEQLVIEKEDEVEGRITTTIPIEDIGVTIFDNQQISVTHGLLEGLLNNNTAVITCDSRHMPIGLLLPLTGNTTQNERYRLQIDASAPLCKKLWQQTIVAKISNQATLLNKKDANTKNMLYWASEVKSGDTENHEARAAAYYWSQLFPPELNFRRERIGEPPNNLLNYGYAILRAIIARSLVASGLLPTLGIHHSNKYNAYCLADDIMEPYRPFVDQVVLGIVQNGEKYNELDKAIKGKLLTVPAMDVFINGNKSPLMIAAQQTTASLFQCFEGTLRKIAYPEFP